MSFYVLDEWEQIFKMTQKHHGQKIDLVVLPEFVVPYGTFTFALPLQAVRTSLKKSSARILSLLCLRGFLACHAVSDTIRPRLVRLECLLPSSPFKYSANAYHHRPGRCGLRSRQSC